MEHAASAGFGVPDRRVDDSPAILAPLFVMVIAFTLLFLTLHLAAMRKEILRRRVRTMLMMQADAAAGP